MADRFILSHIQRLPMFARCNDDQLAACADAFQERNYRAGEVLYTQGEDSHAMYVFVSGGGQIYRNSQPQSTVATGQYVGESSLFNHAARDSTVLATLDSTVIYLTRDALIQAVSARPDLRTTLNERPEWINSLPGAPLSTPPVLTAPGAAQNYYQPSAPRPPARRAPQTAYPPPGYANAAQGGSGSPDFSQESVLLHTRRHLWTVGSKTLGAMIVIAISLSAIVLVSQSPGGLRNAISGFAGLAAIVSVLMIAFWVLEWFGDTFTVTTLRIVHNVRVFPSGADTREQVLLSGVQNVDIVRSGLLSDILGYGNLVIAVAGTRQPMLLDHIPHPAIAQRVILQQVERVGVDPSLFGGVGAMGAGGALPPPIVGGIPQYSAPIRTGGRFWPHTREVIGDRIIYRKHWGVLIGYEIKPVISYILWIGFLTLRTTVTGSVAVAFEQNASILNTLSAAWVFLTTFWVLWEYLRWYNDIYIVDSETVVDIVRQPFGLREVRIQAGLPQIQNVTSETQSVFGTIFNFGDVIIQTAAQQGQMVFYGVHNPVGVADEVLQHVRDYTAGRFTQEQAMNRQAFSQALAGYQGGLPGGQVPAQYPPQQPQQYPPQQPQQYPPQQYPPPNYSQPVPPPSAGRYPQVPPNPNDYPNPRG